MQIGNPQLCTEISDSLLRDKGHYVQAINYPTVPVGEEKLRLAPTPHHTFEMMDHLVHDMVALWREKKLTLKGMECPAVGIRPPRVKIKCLKLLLNFTAISPKSFQNLFDFTFIQKFP